MWKTLQSWGYSFHYVLDETIFCEHKTIMKIMHYCINIKNHFSIAIQGFRHLLYNILNLKKFLIKKNKVIIINIVLIDTIIGLFDNRKKFNWTSVKLNHHERYQNSKPWNFRHMEHKSPPSHPHPPPDRVSEEILPCFILYFSAKTGWTFSICFVTKSIFLLKYSFPLDTSWFNEQKIKILQEET